MTQLVAEPVTGEAFSSYGTVIEAPSRPSDASAPGWTWWAEVAGLPPEPRGYGFGYLRLEPAGSSFDWAERHMRSPELIVPLGGACTVYVGPAEREEPGRLPPLASFRAFRVEPGQAVLLAPGVWHGAPFADGAPGAALVALAVGTGGEDTVVVRFEDTPVKIVQPGGG
jgi:ureidoglycolate hydrolase